MAERNNNEEQTDVNEVLDQGFENYDAMRVGNLKNLETAKLVQTNQLRREHARLLRKYGSEHPLTAQTQAKLELNKIYVVEVEKEIIRAETPVPNEEEEKWKVFGYVLSPTGKPICGVQIFLFDSNKQKLSDSASVETDEKGFFTLEIDNVKQLPDSVYVGLSTKELSPQTLRPVAGQNEYVELTVGERKPTPPDDDLPTSEGWTVMGRILSTKGEGISGLTVKVYDKDIFDDDFLGETKTNQKGIYKVNFPKEKFSDFFENYPEVYLVIENAEGERIYDGRSKTNYGAGYIELMDVELKDSGKSNRGKKRK